MKIEKTVTLLKTGETFESLKSTEGCYEQWFDRVFEGKISWNHVNAPYGDALPDPDTVEALLISGSPVSIYERLAWSVACSEWIAKVWEKNIPILGVCYGHQLLADALGGEVKASSNGREMGAISVSQCGQDPLFTGLGQDFEVWQTHIDEVSRMPDQAKLIATNDHSKVQAMSIGEHCRSIQWHPEMNRAILNHYIIERQAVIDAAWGDGAASTLSSSLPSHLDSGSIIARNFMDLWLKN